MKPGPADLERVLTEHQYPPAARALIEAEVRRLRAPPQLRRDVDMLAREVAELTNRLRAQERRGEPGQALLGALDNATARAVPEVTGAAMHVPMALWTALVEARAALQREPG